MIARNKPGEKNYPRRHQSLRLAALWALWRYVWHRESRSLELDRNGLRELRDRLGLTPRGVERAVELLEATGSVAIEDGVVAPRLRALRAPEGEA
jgi:hypothetical protein